MPFNACARVHQHEYNLRIEVVKWEELETHRLQLKLKLIGNLKSRVLEAKVTGMSDVA